MSFAVRLHSAPRALARSLHFALAGFALIAALFALVFAEPSARGWIALAAFACFALALARPRMIQLGTSISNRSGRAPRHFRRLPQRAAAAGSLHIDEAGRANWIDDGDPARAARPVRIERWNLLGAFAWLQLRRDDAPEVLDVLMSRVPGQSDTPDTAAQDDWRRLRAWLLWYGRGGVSPAALPETSGARQ